MISPKPRIRWAGCTLVRGHTSTRSMLSTRQCRQTGSWCPNPPLLHFLCLPLPAWLHAVAVVANGYFDETSAGASKPLVIGRKHPWLPHLVRFGLLFGSCSSCLCFASGFLPSPHCCDAVALSYLIPPCQRLIRDSHPGYVSCLTNQRKNRCSCAEQRLIVCTMNGSFKTEACSQGWR